jgi:hypothetical protein
MKTPPITDTLQKAVDFINADTTGRRLRLFVNLDSTLAFKIMDKMKGDEQAPPSSTP